MCVCVCVCVCVCIKPQDICKDVRGGGDFVVFTSCGEIPKTMKYITKIYSCSLCLT